MYCCCPAPFPSFFSRETDVAEIVLTEELRRTVRMCRPCQYRDRINHELEIALTLCDGVLGKLPVFNVDVDAIPLDNAARLIAKGINAKQKPPIFSIEAAQARLHFARL